MKRILVVDDDVQVRARVATAIELHREEFSLVTAAHGVEAVRRVEERAVDLVLLDLWMPVMDGFQLLTHLMNRCPGLPVMVLSARSPWDGLRGTGIPPEVPCVTKPVAVHTLLPQVREHLKALAPEGGRPTVTLFGLLQLLVRERKTCVLEVGAEQQVGVLHVLNGELVHAWTSGHEGEGALFEMMRWASPRLRLLPALPALRVSIATRTERLLAQAFSAREAQRALPPVEPPAPGLEPSGPRRAPLASRPAVPERLGGPRARMKARWASPRWSLPH